MSDCEVELLHCGLCRYNTDEDEAFVDHYANEHKKEMRYWCRDCSHPVQSPTELVSHMRESCTKVKSFTFACGVKECAFSCEDAYKFRDHFGSAHKGTLLFPCKECKRFFTIPACLIFHMQKECGKSKISSDSDSEDMTPIASTTERSKKMKTNARDKSKTIKTPISTSRNKLKTTRTKASRVVGRSRRPNKRYADQEASTSQSFKEDSEEEEEEEQEPEPEEEQEPEPEPEYFSLYGKKVDPMDLSNIRVVSSTDMQYTVPVEDFMKISNFNVCLSVPDLRKTGSVEYSKALMA